MAALYLFVLGLDCWAAALLLFCNIWTNCFFLPSFFFNACFAFLEHVLCYAALSFDFASFSRFFVQLSIIIFSVVWEGLFTFVPFLCACCGVVVLSFPTYRFPLFVLPVVELTPENSLTSRTCA